MLNLYIVLTRMMHGFAYWGKCHRLPTHEILLALVSLGKRGDRGGDTDASRLLFRRDCLDMDRRNKYLAYAHRL